MKSRRKIKNTQRKPRLPVQREIIRMFETGPAGPGRLITLDLNLLWVECHFAWKVKVIKQENLAQPETWLIGNPTKLSGDGSPFRKELSRKTKATDTSWVGPGEEKPTSQPHPPPLFTGPRPGTVLYENVLTPFNLLCLCPNPALILGPSSSRREQRLWKSSLLQSKH